MASRNLITQLSRNIGVGVVRILQEAFRDGMENDMRFGSLIAGQSVQSRITPPTTTQKHALGARIATWDGRVFRYAKAGGTLNPDLGAMCNDQQHVAYTTIAASAILGATTVVVDVQSGDGTATNGVIGVNELEKGYIVIFPHSSNTFTRQILSNTVTAAAGEMTLVLDEGIPAAITVDVDHGECMASPYRNVQTTSAATTSVVGMPTYVATVGQYLWLQTYGPCWIAPQGEVSTGNNDRQVVFRHDGSIDQHDSTDANVAMGQHAGFVITNANGGGQGAAFIMLQISI